MTTLQLYRLSGLALVIGTVLWAVSQIVSGVVFPDNNDVAAATNPLNILLGLVSVVGTILALLGLPGMYARTAHEGGLAWLVGMALTAITGMLFGVFLGLMGVIVFPALASRAADLFSEGPPPAFFALFIVATLTNVSGAILMAIPMIRRGIYARWCGYVLLVGAVLAVIGFFASGALPPRRRRLRWRAQAQRPCPGATSLIGQILSVISPLPLAVVLGWAGYRLWSTDKAPAIEGATGSVEGTTGSVAAPPLRLSA